MGEYNPHAPYIIGQEWVPIDDYDLVYSPSVNSVEYGTTFTFDDPKQVSMARFYVQGPISQPMSRQCALVNVYPTGLINSAGPIKQVTIPCTNATVTGSTTLSGSSVTDALYNPSDGGFITFNYNGSNLQYLQMFFNTSAYPQLNGKRILNVSLMYTGSVRDVLADTGIGISITTEFVNPNKLWQSMTVLEQMDDADRTVQFLGENIISNTGTFNLSTSVSNSSFSSVFSEEILPLNLGDVNNFWLPGVQPSGQRTDLPWTYDDLLKFEATAATASRQRLRIQLIIPATAGTASFATFPQVTFRYMALRVTYCDETRVAYGGREFVYNLGANSIPIYSISRQASPTLSPGTYLATLSLVSTGATDFGLNLNGQFPPLNATRELYPIPSHTPIKINVPFPIDESIVDKQFSTEITTILPQLSLHVSGGAALLEPHVYGRQAKGQVYGSFTVTQEIDDTVALGSAEWPWVRFYARRYGNTTVPLTVTIAGSTASIDPEEFDAITEITHEFWREVTLELDPPLVMGTGIIPQAIWSATGEKAGNRWEILGTAAPSITGSIPGSLVTQVPTVQRLGPATYGQPVSGSTINMAWLPQLGPYVTSTTDDESADVSVIFSQSPPVISGFGAESMSQVLTGIGQNCGIDPCCVPSELYYTRLSWTPPGGPPEPSAVAPNLYDIFDRSETNSWGTPNIGPAYTAFNLASALSVVDNVGLITVAAGPGTVEGALISAADSANFDVTVTLSNQNGGAMVAGISARSLTDAHETWISVNSSSSVDLILANGSGLLVSLDISTNSYITTGAGSAVNIRFMIDGDVIKVKTWAPNTTEPTMWQIETTDTAITDIVDYLIFAEDLSGAGAIIGVSDLQISPPRYWFGSYEIQRMDTVEPEWKTIMKATNPALSEFNDFEARVGIVSTYRIRQLNVYDFYGPWSTEVSGMVPAPGVEIGCLGDNGHVLIFTSNERQDGGINLAYSSVWLDEQVEENFTFPEAGFVQMQAMYDRDFYVAFRPLERGGEQFSRTLLVQAAAIAPETLADFTSLRDMAWATVNYICVRDEDANRWLATVSVPSGNVLRNRRMYLAPVQISEVTDTPTPVDASPWPI